MSAVDEEMLVCVSIVVFVCVSGVVCRWFILWRKREGSILLDFCVWTLLDMHTQGGVAVGTQGNAWCWSVFVRGICTEVMRYI